MFVVDTSWIYTYATSANAVLRVPAWLRARVDMVYIIMSWWCVDAELSTVPSVLIFPAVFLNAVLRAVTSRFSVWDSSTVRYYRRLYGSRSNYSGRSCPVNRHIFTQDRAVLSDMC